MSFYHGKNTELWLDAADVTDYFRSAEFSAEVDTAETTTFGKSWKTYVPGQASSTVDLGGLYDPTFGDIRDLVPAGTGAVLTVGPHGLSAVGDLARLISVESTSYSESSPIGDVVAFNYGVMANGQVGMGHVLKPLAAVTSSANGTTFNGGAASANGAVAHLHVTSVSASDSVDVTIEDSADGSSGWATIGTFSTASAAGAQRLVIAGTVRQYLRAVWAVTGTDVSITFGVAIARL